MAERFRSKGRSGSFVEAVAATMFPTPKASDGEDGGRGELLALVRGKKTRQLWPTPQASDSKRGADARDRPGSGGPNLNYAVKVAMWPTPQAADRKSTGQPGTKSHANHLARGSLLTAAVTETTGGGQLNPTWVEWLMGFPLGWTDCAASETPSCPKSSS
jgi:hypothetical protein